MSVVETEEQTEIIIDIFNRLAAIGRRERQQRHSATNLLINEERPTGVHQVGRGRKNGGIAYTTTHNNKKTSKTQP